MNHNLDGLPYNLGDTLVGPAAMHEKQFCQKPAPSYNVAAVGAHTGVRLWWTLFLMLEFLTFTWMTGSEET